MHALAAVAEMSVLVATLAVFCDGPHKRHCAGAVHSVTAGQLLTACCLLCRWDHDSSRAGVPGYSKLSKLPDSIDGLRSLQKSGHVRVQPVGQVAR